MGSKLVVLIAIYIATLIATYIATYNATYIHYMLFSAITRGDHPLSSVSVCLGSSVQHEQPSGGKLQAPAAQSQQCEQEQNSY